MSFEYNNKIILRKRLGTSEDPYISLDETHIVNTDAKVILSELPSTFNRVTVVGDNKTWFELSDGLPKENEFKVDYLNKSIVFHSSNIGKQLNFNYIGMGLHYLPQDMIYTEESNGVVTETLKQLTDEMKLRKTEAETAIANANTATTNATEQANYAKTQGDYVVSEIVNFETLKQDTIDATNDAIQATYDADVATTNANNKADLAQTKANLAEQKANEAVTAKNNADAATSLANSAATFANTKATLADDKATLAQNKINEMTTLGNTLTSEVNNLKLNRKTPVANFAAIATTYPSPSVGWYVQTLDDGKFYRYDGSVWQFDMQITGTAIADIQNQFAEANSQSTILSQGVSVIPATEDTLADVVIEGNTLTSLAVSDLILDKCYVLASKKTKVRVDNITYTGVTKFQKKSTLTSKADFVGKVQGDTVANPNNPRRSASSSLLTPSGFTSDMPDVEIGRIVSLNGISSTLSNSTNGNIAQHLFSWDLIAHIERNMGRIPKTTVADKVQWLKDNVSTYAVQWYGMGSSVGGNGATLSIWRADNSTWTTVGSHTNATVTKIGYTATVGNGFVNLGIDANGYVHFLAHTTNPSDGVTPSSISTDFVELQVDLKPTAVLSTKPILIRVENFEGKVSASTVENPHVAKYKSSTSLDSPSTFATENNADQYNRASKLDGTTYGVIGATVSGYYAQTLFSFDIIQAIERNLGRIPKATLAEKVQWVKDNVAEVNGIWSGFGSSVGGNKATLSWWNGTSWTLPVSHTLGTVGLLNRRISASLSSAIDVNGVISYLAHADASDGVVASTINTDYISCEIELKPDVILHDPSVPLYEVDSTTYGQILTTMDENTVLTRFPKVVGSQSTQGVAVIAEGENLLPSFYEATSIHANATIKAPYELELNATAANQHTNYEIIMKSNTSYTFNIETTGTIRRTIYKMDGSVLSNTTTMALPFTYTPTEDVKTVIHLTSLGAGLLTFKKPMLNVGSTAKPFVPRNPSMLLADVKLGSLSDKKDSLFKSDGAWYVRKLVEKDVVLDGILAWTFQSDNTGFKIFEVPIANTIVNNSMMVATKFNGSKLSNGSTGTGADFIGATTGAYRISVSDIDTGLGESYSATNDESKAIFNGWQAKTVDANGKPTAWRSLGDGTDAPTQTLTYVSSNKAPNFTPYKLSYLLSSPQLINVSDKLEGEIALNGQTQVSVDSGFIVEKVTFDSGTKRATTSKPSRSILSVRKGSTKEPFKTYTSNGQTLPELLNAVDTNQSYYVVYQTDKHTVTNNPVDLKVIYSSNFKGVLDKTVESLADNTTQISIHTKLLVEIMARLKAGSL